MFKIKCLRSLIVVKCVKKMSKALKSPLLLMIMTSLSLGKKNQFQNSLNGLSANTSL